MEFEQIGKPRTRFPVHYLCEFKVSYRSVVFLELSRRRSGRNTGLSLYGSRKKGMAIILSD